MKVTLEIDDDVLHRAEEAARERGQSTQQFVSQLLRESMPPEPEFRNGFRLLPRRNTGFRPDMELVNRLRDEE